MKPWSIKDDKKRLNTIIYVTLEMIRKLSVLLFQTSRLLRGRLGGRLGGHLGRRLGRGAGRAWRRACLRMVHWTRLCNPVEHIYVCSTHSTCPRGVAYEIAE